MVALHRVRVTLTGFPGGPGVSTFYALDAPALLGPLSTFYFSLKSYIPGAVTVGFEDVGDIIDPVTGILTGSWAGTPGQPFPGEYTGSYSAPSGLAATWNTGTILDGHRLRGRTFMVPLGNSVYQNDGTIDPVALTAFRAAADSLVAAAPANLAVWHRPRLVPARAGGYAVVSSATVNDRVAVLRSRRD